MSDKFEELYHQIPKLISKINSDLTPNWGSMHVHEMMEHLTTGFELSLSYEDFEITTPEEKITSFQRFLMSDRPFGKGSPMPKNYQNFKTTNSETLERAKERFVGKLKELKEITESDSKFWSIHENFGRLNAEQTRQLHFKHITHHFTQFGVIQ